MFERFMVARMPVFLAECARCGRVDDLKKQPSRKAAVARFRGRGWDIKTGWDKSLLDPWGWFTNASKCPACVKRATTPRRGSAAATLRCEGCRKEVADSYLYVRVDASMQLGILPGVFCGEGCLIPRHGQSETQRENVERALGFAEVGK